MIQVAIKTGEKCKTCPFIMEWQCRHSGKTLKELYAVEKVCLDHRAPVHWKIFESEV